VKGTTTFVAVSSAFLVAINVTAFCMTRAPEKKFSTTNSTPLSKLRILKPISVEEHSKLEEKSNPEKEPSDSSSEENKVKKQKKKDKKFKKQKKKQRKQKIEKHVDVIEDSKDRRQRKKEVKKEKTHHKCALCDRMVENPMFQRCSECQKIWKKEINKKKVEKHSKKNNGKKEAMPKTTEKKPEVKSTCKCGLPKKEKKDMCKKCFTSLKMAERLHHEEIDKKKNTKKDIKVKRKDKEFESKKDVDPKIAERVDEICSGLQKLERHGPNRHGGKEWKVRSGGRAGRRRGKKWWDVYNQLEAEKEPHYDDETSSESVDYSDEDSYEPRQKGKKTYDYSPSKELYSPSYKRDKKFEKDKEWGASTDDEPDFEEEPVIKFHCKNKVNPKLEKSCPSKLVKTGDIVRHCKIPVPAIGKNVVKVGTDKETVGYGYVVCESAFVTPSHYKGITHVHVRTNNKLVPHPCTKVKDLLVEDALEGLTLYTVTVKFSFSKIALAPTPAEFPGIILNSSYSQVSACVLQPKGIMSYIADSTFGDCGQPIVNTDKNEIVGFHIGVDKTNRVARVAYGVALSPSLLRDLDTEIKKLGF